MHRSGSRVCAFNNKAVHSCAIPYTLAGVGMRHWVQLAWHFSMGYWHFVLWLTHVWLPRAAGKPFPGHLVESFAKLWPSHAVPLHVHCVVLLAVCGPCVVLYGHPPGSVHVKYGVYGRSCCVGV